MVPRGMDEDYADEHYSEYGDTPPSLIGMENRALDQDPCPDGCVACNLCWGAKW